jgi:uncharacterized protein YlxW (UPF0749 family)
VSDEIRTPADGVPPPAPPAQRQGTGDGRGVPASREAPEAGEGLLTPPAEAAGEAAGERAGVGEPATPARDEEPADGRVGTPAEVSTESDGGSSADAPVNSPADAPVDPPVDSPVDEHVTAESAGPVAEPGVEPSAEPVAESPAEPVAEPVAEFQRVAGSEPEPTAEEGSGSAGTRADDVPEAVQPGIPDGAPDDATAAPQLPGDPDPSELPPREVARGRLGRAMRPRATRAQLLAGVLCALLGFALVVQARQTQIQGLDSVSQSDLVRLLDNVTNAEARAEQDVRDEQAILDRLRSGTDSSAAAQEAARERLDTLGILAGTVPASGRGIELEISDPRRQVDSSVLLDTVEELRDGGAEVMQIGDVRVVASTAFTDDADGVRVDQRLLAPPYLLKVIGDPQTLARLLQIPGGVLDVLTSKGAQGKVTQPAVVTVDALRPASAPQYARPAQDGGS